VKDEQNQRLRGPELRFDRGRKLRLSSSGASITIEEHIGGGYRDVYRVADASGVEYGLLWLRPESGDWELSRARLLSTMKRVHPAFVWPIDLVLDDDLDERGVLLPLLENRLVSLSTLLLRPDGPSIASMIAIGSELADALSRLHGSGLCFPGLDSNVLFVDQESCEIALIRWDAVSDGSIDFKGRWTFMAPEWAKGEA
jgi:hypothetical protein